MYSLLEWAVCKKHQRGGEVQKSFSNISEFPPLSSSSWKETDMECAKRWSNIMDRVSHAPYFHISFFLALWSDDLHLQFGGITVELKHCQSAFSVSNLHSFTWFIGGAHCKNQHSLLDPTCPLRSHSLVTLSPILRHYMLSTAPSSPIPMFPKRICVWSYSEM